MKRNAAEIIALALTLFGAGCADESARSSAWALEDTDGGDTGFDDADGFDPEGGTDDGAVDGGDAPDPDGGTDPDPDGGTGPAPPMYDCSPAWASTWIGSPCASDADCTYEGGTCLREDEGFACGTCSQPCTMLCPDLPGTPETFCVDGADVGLDAAGYCLSQCDPAIVPGNGCRDGYVCDFMSRYDGSSVAEVCVPDPGDGQGPMGEPGLVDEIDHAFLIAHFGGTVVDAFAYSDDLAGFQMYLDDVGVQYTSAAEIAEPYNVSAATMCGYSILLPSRDQWEKAAALGLFTDVLTELVGEPIFMRNWWRPPCYNDAVGGAPGGDHPDADAVDLDFASATSRSIAQEFLCTMYWNEDIVGPEEIAPGANLDPRLNMSVGLGGVTIHLGVLSAGGRRFWYYDSYSAEPNSGDCW